MSGMDLDEMLAFAESVVKSPPPETRPPTEIKELCFECAPYPGVFHLQHPQDQVSGFEIKIDARALSQLQKIVIPEEQANVKEIKMTKKKKQKDPWGKVKAPRFHKRKDKREWLNCTRCPYKYAKPEDPADEIKWLAWMKRNAAKKFDCSKVSWVVYKSNGEEWEGIKCGPVRKR